MNEKGESETVTRYRKVIIAISMVVIVGVSLSAGIVVAQEETQTWSEDFEEFDIGETPPGWSDRGDGPIEVSSESYHGTQSLEIDGDETELVRWDSGPVLDTSDDFEIMATVRPVDFDNSYSNRIVVGDGLGGEGPEGMEIRVEFDHESDSTTLETLEADSPGDQDTIEEDTIDGSTSFNDEWVTVRLSFDSAEESITASAWSVSDSEPSDPMASVASIDHATPFQVSAGTSTEGDRQMWIDQVHIEGFEAIDPNLELDAPALLQHGETGNYTVDYVEFDEEEQQNVSIDVTNESDVVSQDASGLQVDESESLLIATDDEEFNDRVSIRAEYEDSVTYEEVTVASHDIENIDVLPPAYRISATIGDSTTQLLIISIFASIAATRIASAFAGLGAMQLVIIVGWFGGHVSAGLMMVGLFTAMFIGFNLAANIDYTVRR